jgi:TetR/AcrR family transcriptional regulator, transcriptional repressor for nem operon
MRYKPGHKEEKRKLLLKACARLVKQNGFAATGVDALMQAAGATSGAFYSHFGSKDALFKALIQNELLASQKAWAGNPHETAEDWLCFELDRYLSLSHVDHPEAGCVLPALAPEIARADVSVRALCEAELSKGHAILSQRLGSDALAWAAICQLVGAIAIARSVSSQAAQRAIVDSSKRFLKSMVAQSRSVDRP